MGKRVVLKTDRKRNRDKLYCCGTADDGCLTVMEVDRSARSQGKKKK
jgi:hypothetical protein